MKVNWSRGFFRAWLALSLAWVGSIGWYEYVNKPWNVNWAPASIRTEGECWTRLAKWPDGQPFDRWDLGEEVDNSSNVEINKKKGAWQASSIPERNRWVAATTQKLIACEAAAPIMQRLARQVTRIWDSEKDDAALLSLPPLGLLIMGWIIGWIGRGFHERAKLP
ncbi:hypothetical protein SAMN05444159_2062 [Bradyrhizobium lablabi]|uniref:Uncharacterized protein n=1 Tax=Bradyrhizobium lablabi TaxID=722472 RepID=A0A1M6NPU1_9BRAD|nr:hypothetical protein [Bradyrhizobium lablabi]SHJ97582.1 hypothetical protein SAMN05444159_2062 [Bradyrhizobium lablabi]